MGSFFYHILLSRFTIDTYSVRWQWAIPFLNFVCKLCMLFRGFSSSNCPNLTGIMSYLIKPHTCRAFLKYALIAFLFYCQSAICEDKDKVMLMKKKLMPTRLLGKIITFLFPADLALCLTFYQASNNDILFFFLQWETINHIAKCKNTYVVCFSMFFVVCMFLLCWYVIFSTVAGWGPSVWIKITFFQISENLSLTFWL